MTRRYFTIHYTVKSKIFKTNFILTVKVYNSERLVILPKLLELAYHPHKPITIFISTNYHHLTLIHTQHLQPKLRLLKLAKL